MPGSQDCVEQCWKALSKLGKGRYIFSIFLVSTTSSTKVLAMTQVLFGSREKFGMHSNSRLSARWKKRWVIPKRERNSLVRIVVGSLTRICFERPSSSSLPGEHKWQITYLPLGCSRQSWQILSVHRKASRFGIIKWVPPEHWCRGTQLKEGTKTISLVTPADSHLSVVLRDLQEKSPEARRAGILKDFAFYWICEAEGRSWRSFTEGKVWMRP